MRLPSQYALTYPERHEGPAERLDLTTSLNFEFEPPDEEIQVNGITLGEEFDQKFLNAFASPSRGMRLFASDCVKRDSI